MSTDHNWGEAHEHITRHLLESHYKNQQCPLDALINCLGIIAWLLGCSSKVLHLQDLFVTLVVLCALRNAPMTTHAIAPSLPTFEVTPHIGVSPQDVLFQNIILREMIRILDIHRPENATLRDLSKAVFKHFKGILRTATSSSWIRKKGGVLTVMKDQSRYMTMRDEHIPNDLDMMRAHLNQVVNKYKWDTSSPNSDSCKHMEHVMKLLQETEPNANDAKKILPRLESCENSTVAILNHIHHAILNNETIHHYGENHPPFRNWNSNDGWIDVKNYLEEFLTKFARSIIRDASDTTLARIAIALQQIIALRSYVNSIYTSIEAVNKVSTTHAEMIIFFVAFRTLVMYKLSIRVNPSKYGVQQVAETLPNYAKRLALTLPTDVNTPKPCKCTKCRITRTLFC